MKEKWQDYCLMTIATHAKLIKNIVFQRLGINKCVSLTSLSQTYLIQFGLSPILQTTLNNWRFSQNQLCTLWSLVSKNLCHFDGWQLLDCQTVIKSVRTFCSLLIIFLLFFCTIIIITLSFLRLTVAKLSNSYLSDITCYTFDFHF